MSSSGLDWDAVNEGGDLLVLVHPARAQGHGDVSTAPGPASQESIPGVPSGVKDPQPGHCPAHTLPLPCEPYPQGPQPREAVASAPR